MLEEEYVVVDISWNTSQSRVDTGRSHKLELLKTNLRRLCFDEPVQILPFSGNNDGVFRTVLPTSLLQSSFVGFNMQMTRSRERLAKISICCKTKEQRFMQASFQDT